MATPVWFITAASSGFGREIALLALQRGHTVVATARSTSRIQDLADAGAHTLAFDVTSPVEEIKKTAQRVFEEHGRVDYLINAAGFILEGAVEETSAQEMYDSFNTNVFGAVNTINAFLKGMREQEIGVNGKRGTVVTFGSLGSWNGGAGYAMYGMTKASCSSLAESLREELRPFKIDATVIEPGYFRTSFLNPTAKVQVKNRIEAYAGEDMPTKKAKRALEATDGKQLGDVKKGCQVAVDILTGEGVGKGREVPVRIVLGSDCDAYIRKQFEDTVKILDEWKEVTVSTDYPKGE